MGVERTPEDEANSTFNLRQFKVIYMLGLSVQVTRGLGLSADTIDLLLVSLQGQKRNPYLFIATPLRCQTKAFIKTQSVFQL